MRDLTMSSEEFKDARDFLLALRTDYSTAKAKFAWPKSDCFNWALDWFDDELAALGQKIESAGREFDEERFKRENEKRFYETDTPPPNLGNERMGNDNDDGGCSFVIMDFSAA